MSLETSPRGESIRALSLPLLFWNRMNATREVEIGKDTLQRSLDCLRRVGMCAAYGQASGVPDPIDIVKDLGARGSLIITRPALSHYISNRSEIDAAAKSLFDAVARGVVASNVVKTFPLREAAAAHKFIGGRKTTGSIVMLPFA